MIKTAFILAAGRGERLRPLTDRYPKPMLSFKGKPLIEHLIIQLRKAGITRIVINHAYLGCMIRHHLQDGTAWHVQILYSSEPPGALQTGGGLIKALPLLGHDPFLCISGDIVTDFPFEKLHTITSSAHLILRSTDTTFPQGDFDLKNNRVYNEPKTYVYANIAYFHPDLFQHQPMARYRLATLLRTLIQTQCVTGEIYTGMWHNIGTIETLQSLSAM